MGADNVVVSIDAKEIDTCFLIGRIIRISLTRASFFYFIVAAVSTVMYLLSSQGAPHLD